MVSFAEPRSNPAAFRNETMSVMSLHTHTTDIEARQQYNRTEADVAFPHRWELDEAFA